jgi:hypothetical protein
VLDVELRALGYDVAALPSVLLCAVVQEVPGEEIVRQEAAALRDGCMAPP